MKDILIRALKTFWQAFAAYAIINSEALFMNITEFDLERLKQFGLALAVGAVSAGLSALYNGVLRPLADKFTK